ncbi:transcriptional regulator [Methylolobus aquaticus]|nr:transcriptional regulator [Methylolobus aquaticus]
MIRLFLAATRLRRWSLGFLAMACCLQALATDLTQGGDEADVAVALLEKMRTAMSELQYRGIIAYSRDNKVEHIEFVHAVSNGVEHERLVSLSGPMREVIRQGQEVRCYLHDSRTVLVETKTAGRDLFDLPANFQQLRPNYMFILGGRDRIAQRDAQAVAIIARDDMRYGRRVWVDSSSNLPLKVEIIDGTDTVVEQMVFSSLDLATPVSAEQLEPSTKTGPNDWETREQVGLPIDSLRWTLHGVPVGFQIASFRRIRNGAMNRPVEHLLLSDGLTSVSVYFDEVGEKLVVGQPTASGAIHSFSRKIDDFLVTAIGEIPARTAQAIANGIRHRGASAD